MLVNGIDQRQRTLWRLREHPVDILLDVPILLRGEGHVVEQHVQSLLGIVHAQLVERGTITGASELPVLETWCIKNMDAGACFSVSWALHSSVDHHDKCRYGLLVEPHDERIKSRRTIPTLGCDDWRPVGVDRPRVREVEVRALGRGAEEVGETEGRTARRVEDVLAEILVVDAEDDGCSLCRGWVQETLTASH